MSSTGLHFLLYQKAFVIKNSDSVSHQKKRGVGSRAARSATVLIANGLASHGWTTAPCDYGGSAARLTIPLSTATLNSVALGLL